MNSMADVLRAHLERTGGNVVGLNSGSHKGGNASKAKSVADRAKNRAYILSLFDRIERPLTVCDVKLDKSVARRELQDLVKDSLITATASYGGNYVYTRNPPTLLKMRWRKTQPDTSYQPRYY